MELTSSSSRNLLVNSVKQVFERGTIRTVNVAENLIKLTQQNKMDEFDQKFAKVEAAENTKAAKQQAQEISKEVDYTKEEKELKHHTVKINNRKSEQPTFEVRFKAEHKTFDEAWRAGVSALVKLASNRIREKRNLKIVVGCELKIAKTVAGADEDEKTIHVHTMHSEDAVDKFIRSKKGDLAKRVQTRIEHQAGSGWSVKKVTTLFITTYSQKPSRGSSYIPRPPELCGA